MSTNRYLDEFFSLRCAPDVLATVGRVQNMSKEITEAMAMIRHVRSIIRRNPDERYHLLDLCAGNALTSVISAHLFPNLTCEAVDIKPRQREWWRTNRFVYTRADIRGSLGVTTPRHIIIAACHPCSSLARCVINQYYSIGRHLILMPCCVGGSRNVPQMLRDKLGSYGSWCYDLYCEASMYCFDSNMIEDKHVLSPNNIIITADKGY